MRTRYKFLRKVGRHIRSDSGDVTWHIEEWQHIDGDLKLCERGFHCSQTPYQAFSYVQGEILALVEVKGKELIEDDKEAYSDMRIVKAWKWTKKDSVAFAIYAAELVLENFEKKYPEDKRPREAIEAAKKVLFKDTPRNRSAADSAAWSAESAAWSAASSAESAARSAAESAESAAWSAASSAESAAWSAAESAARSAESAARSAIYRKLGTWMEEHIKEMEEII